VFLHEAGVVIAFAVVLVAETPDGMVNIARYDTAHGIAHRDVLGRRKGLLRKQWFPKVPFAKVLDLAIKDFKQHHESYVRHFDEN
jgi:hypothetical protein